MTTKTQLEAARADMDATYRDAAALDARAAYTAALGDLDAVATTRKEKP